MKIERLNVWASCVACLAIAAVAAGSAFAQNEEEYNSPRSERGAPSNQSRERGEQSWQDEQQSRSQQRGQRDQQEWQRDQQNRFSRDAQRSADQSDRQNNQGGLGVSIRSDGGPGVVIIRVNRNTPADNLGLEPRDRITQVDGRRVESIAQFIREIRNKRPGQEVELQVQRAGKRENETFRAQLQSRQEAVARFNAQRQRDVRQSGYEEEGGYGVSQGRSSRGQSTARLQQIERQVDRLSEQIEQLRYALRDYREQSSREQQAGYNEYQSDRPRRSAERWQDSESQRYDGQQRSRQSRDQDSRDAQRSANQRSQQSGQYGGEQGPTLAEPQQSNSPGGEIGEERLRPDNIPGE